MRKYLHFLLFLTVVFLALPGHTNSVRAASLEFDKTTHSVKNNETFSLQVIVNPGSDQITSTDIYVLYDKAILTAQKVDAGTYFPTVLDDIQPGKVYIAGLVEDPTSYKTGVGTVAKITFKSTAEGTANITFDCRAASDSSKIIKNDINATNIITCSSNKSTLVTVGSLTNLPNTSGSTTGTPTPTPTSSVTSTPTPTFTPIPTRIATNSATLSAVPVSGNADTAMALFIPGVLFMLFAGVFKFVGRI